MEYPNSDAPNNIYTDNYSSTKNKSLGGAEKSVEPRHDLWFAIFHILSQAVIFVALSLIIVLQNTSCSVFLANSDIWIDCNIACYSKTTDAKSCSHGSKQGENLRLDPSLIPCCLGHCKQLREALRGRSSSPFPGKEVPRAL
jgi:hypothetical protein